MLRDFLAVCLALVRARRFNALSMFCAIVWRNEWPEGPGLAARIELGPATEVPKGTPITGATPMNQYSVSNTKDLEIPVSYKRADDSDAPIDTAVPAIVSSSDESVATVALSPDFRTLRVTTKANGTVSCSIKVDADPDANGMKTIEQTFEVTVHDEFAQAITLGEGVEVAKL